MIHPNTRVTGRTRLFSLVEVFDHERETWVTWDPLRSGKAIGVDSVLQAAVDRGHDDIRLVLHVTGVCGDAERSLSAPEDSRP